MTLESAVAEVRQFRSLAAMVWPDATQDQLDEYSVLAFMVKYGPRNRGHITSSEDGDFLRSIGIAP